MPRDTAAGVIADELEGGVLLGRLNPSGKAGIYPRSPFVSTLWQLGGETLLLGMKRIDPSPLGDPGCELEFFMSAHLPPVWILASVAGGR